MSEIFLQPSQIIEHLAHMCYFAQDHVQFVENESDKRHQLEAVSYVVSCYLSRVTRDGQQGVEWDVVINELTDKRLPVSEWRKVIVNAINEYGGFEISYSEKAC